jgi:hypothetical protein
MAVGNAESGSQLRMASPTQRGGAARWKRLAVGGWEHREAAEGHDVVLPLPYGHHAAAAASQLFTMPAVPPRGAKRRVRLF